MGRGAAPDLVQRPATQAVLRAARPARKFR